jgi:hypothetical protein
MTDQREWDCPRRPAPPHDDGESTAGAHIHLPAKAGATGRSDRCAEATHTTKLAVRPTKKANGRSPMRAWMRSPAAYGPLIAACAGAGRPARSHRQPVPATGAGNSSAQPAPGSCPRHTLFRQALSLPRPGPRCARHRDCSAARAESIPATGAQRAQLLRRSPAHAGARRGASHDRNCDTRPEHSRAVSASYAATRPPLCLTSRSARPTNSPPSSGARGRRRLLEIWATQAPTALLAPCRSRGFFGWS